MAKSKNLSGVHHAHGCRRCAVRYDDACTTPAEDGLCWRCRGSTASQVLIDNRLPRECCRELARLVTKDEKVTYQLAGAKLWFICPRCARTHPFNPIEKRTP